MNMKIYPSKLSGSVLLPPSKSIFHRALICAGLSRGETVITPAVLNDDITATAGAVRSLGGRVLITDKSVTVNGITEKREYAEIDANESGSTLRFMIPAAAAVSAKTKFTGRGRLPLRPLTPYHTMFETYEHGNDELPLTVGGLKGSKFTLPGNISSQFISGILLAMPLIEGARLEVTETPQSLPYINITIDIMKKFGVTVRHENYRKFTVSGSYTPRSLKVEGDWSAASFWIVANALGGSVECLGLAADSCQGDRSICDLLCGCTFGKSFTISRRSLDFICADVSDIPDTVPALAVLGCFCEGGMHITNAGRLRLKESDRIDSTARMITALGGNVRVCGDEMYIEETGALEGGCTVSSFGDHRIAMAAAIAGAFCKKPVVIEGAECVSKSYPSFFDDFIKSGGKADELNMGQ